MDTATQAGSPALELRTLLHDGKKTALGRIDMQNDFLAPRGTLRVNGGEELIQQQNLTTEVADSEGWEKWISGDQHPADSKHFEKWPPHCVAGTWGARFHERLNLEGFTTISKGQDPNDDGGYSAFEGFTDQGICLLEHLSSLKVERLVIDGVATDYCVKATVLHALKFGFEVLVISDGIAAVNREPQDGPDAIEEMTAAGARFVTFAEIKQALVA